MELQKECNIEKGKGKILTTSTWPCCVISLTRNLPPMKRLQKKEWKDAMIEEYQSFMNNDVWEIESIPKKKSIVTSKWIYKIKHTTDGSIEKYKARFVA